MRIIRYVVCLAGYAASLCALFFLPTTQQIHYGGTPPRETFSLLQIDSLFLSTTSPTRTILWDTVGVRFLLIWGITSVALLILFVLGKRRP